MPRNAVLSFCVLAAVAVPAAAWAHAVGIAAMGCEGCHSGGQTPTVTLTASPTAPAVGQQVTLTVTVSQTNGPVAGFFLTSDEPVGTFKAIQAGTAVSGGGVMHTMPHTGSNGVTIFQAAWSASQATGVRFTAYALSANGDGTSRGDGGSAASLAMTAGCPGTDYYVDQDGDGYGTSDPAFVVARACTRPDGYAAVGGDCDDVDATIHPGAVEVCNGKDDNCNGQIDEGLAQQFFCRDRDGDGHGVATEGEEASCRPMTGYGDCGGDCDDSDPAVYVQFTCGVGWCKRAAFGCSTSCTPGPPQPEVCNAFDDDCDGVADNGTDLEVCGAAGLKCVAGVCVTAGSAGAGTGGHAAGAGGSGGTSSGDPGSSGGGGGATDAVAGGCAMAPLPHEGIPGVTLSIIAVLAARRTRRRR